MQIKDVEKITGLTAKSIRYYEDKGLISVERKNTYRNYTEENVQQLKEIKIYRYLDFSIDEIKQLLNMNMDELKETLNNKLKMYQKEIDTYTRKTDILYALEKDIDKNEFIIDEYNDQIDFIENEGKEFIELNDDFKCPSLFETICQCLIYSGPILWLFFNIIDKKYDVLLFNSILAIPCTVLLTLEIKKYFYYKKFNKVRMKDKNGSTLSYVIVLIVSIFMVFVIAVGSCFLIETMYAPENWLFYQIGEYSEVGMILLFVFMAIYLVMNIVYIFKKEDESFKKNELFEIYSFISNKKAICLIVWIVCVYCCISHVTFVTKDSIICYGPLNPSGTIYSYQDVDHIYAGYGSKTLTLKQSNKKGEFSYQITIDNKTIVFTQPTDNEDIKEYEDTYKELEVFDQELMKYNIEKTSDDTYASYCDYDQQYIDRYQRIIENK